MRRLLLFVGTIPVFCNVAMAQSQSETGPYLGSLVPIMKSIQEDRGYALSFERRGTLSVEQWRLRARRELRRALAYSPAPSALDVKVHAVRKCDGYQLREISFAGSPYYRVPAFLLIPDKGRRPLPGVVALHDHGGYFYFGKEKIVEVEPEHASLMAWKRDVYGGRSYASELARRGFVVIVTDAFYWGDRRIKYDHPPEDFRKVIDGLDPIMPQYVDAVNNYLEQRVADLTTQLGFCGLSWLGIVAFDDMRSVDLLASLPEVDPKRIGCVGLSGGGYRATYLAGLDPRIRAAVIVGWMSALPSTLDLPHNTHSDLFDSFLIHAALDHPDVASLAAPDCAVLLQNCARDRLFTHQGMDLASEKIRHVYEELKKPERFRSKYFDVPHSFDVSMQEEAFQWLKDWLK